MKTPFAAPKMPMFDPEAVMAAQKRNIDAWTSASTILADGAKAFYQRQVEITQAAVDEFVVEAEGMMKNGATEYQPADQMARMKVAYEKALSNAQELSNIAVKAQTEAFGVLSSCAMANFDNVKKAAA